MITTVLLIDAAIAGKIGRKTYNPASVIPLSDSLAGLLFLCFSGVFGCLKVLSPRHKKFPMGLPPVAHVGQQAAGSNRASVCRMC